MRIEEDRKIDNRFIATMIIDRLEEDDFEEENHILRSRSFSFLPVFRHSGFQAFWRLGFLAIQRDSTTELFFLLHIFQPIRQSTSGTIP